ncbi:hypothetical protein GK047_13720 [Paenibacillus sp. SYP-B3998]|uniref:Uncharacterized protein n=1 Tax=Paenibacillus sp. SYP-B3998 TaxID=2678564 RepID=A0A6G3ZY75_9BACL|nr:hypothetical protein [Paenibacillus sp. SYP-B3998]NEW07065.1 hypothetical protein [Paenibacillus sp. SYP-B3998]
MSISFTQAIITRLNSDIADIQMKSKNEKKKKDKALSKINQLQRDIKISSSPSDLSSKMSRISKLKEEVNTCIRLEADLAKQLVSKHAELKKHLSKTPQQVSKQQEPQEQ